LLTFDYEKQGDTELYYAVKNTENKVNYTPYIAYV